MMLFIVKSTGERLHRRFHPTHGSIHSENKCQGTTLAFSPSRAPRARAAQSCRKGSHKIFPCAAGPCAAKRSALNRRDCAAPTALYFFSIVTQHLPLQRASAPRAMLG